jgi:transposase InsO family protein
MEMLASQERSPSTRQGDIKNYTDTYVLNQRFNWVVNKTGPFLLKRWRWEEVVVDTKTNSILARYVDHSTGNGYVGGEADLPKFWLHRDNCPGGDYNTGLMTHFVSAIKQANGGVK